MSTTPLDTDGVPVSDFVYRMITRWGWSMVGAYYSLEVCGEPFPERAGVVLVAGHRNGLADAALLMNTTHRPLRFLVKYKLMSMPVLGPIITRSGAVPIYRKKDGVNMSRNAEAFTAVHKALARREVITIFPEGSSHSEPNLGDMKSGAARMALGALEETKGSTPLAIQPVGFVYSERDRFRSHLTAVIGKPIDPADYAADYATNPRSTVERLTADLRAGICAASLELDDWSDLPGIELAERLRPGAGISRAERSSELARGLAWLRERRPDRAQRLEALARELDQQLGRAHRLPEALSGQAQPRWIAAALGLLGLAVSTAVYLPPAVLARVIGLVARPTADKLVTTQLLSAFVLFPLWVAFALATAQVRGGVAALSLTALTLGACAWFAKRYWPRMQAWRARIARALTPGADDTAWQASAARMGQELDRLERFGARPGSSLRPHEQHSTHQTGSNNIQSRANLR